MKLLGILLPDAKPVNMGDLKGFPHRYLNCIHAMDGTIGWVIAIRQGSVFVIVPPVDKQVGTPKVQPGAYEFSRSQCVLVWDEHDVEKYTKHEQSYTTEPLRRRDAPPIPEMDQPKAAAGVK